MLVDVFFTNIVKGSNGAVPEIGSNLNWWIGGKDTGVRAKGDTPAIGENGNWWINGGDTGKPSAPEIPETEKIPRGVIVMWSGPVTNIPSGWTLCDSNNGTPDLRAKFIVGYDSRDTDYDSIGKEGGEKSVKLSEYNLPMHNHLSGLTTLDIERAFKHGCLELAEGVEMERGPWQKPVYEGYTDVAGYEGEDLAGIDLRPPFYTLAYIMKL